MNRDDMDTFYDDVEANEDSKSDARVSLIIILGVDKEITKILNGDQVGRVVIKHGE